ncbi:MAG: TnpV protein [Lawsonibacter sp.]|nr:TnpV protein [Lawsonibacter sp.]
MYAHLLETEDTANDLLDSMMPGMAKEAGATEDLKARDPMLF